MRSLYSLLFDLLFAASWVDSRQSEKWQVFFSSSANLVTSRQATRWGGQLNKKGRICVVSLRIVTSAFIKTFLRSLHLMGKNLDNYEYINDIILIILGI